MWEIHLPPLLALETPHTTISIWVCAKWLQNNNKLEHFQNNVFHPLCKGCESPNKQGSPGEISHVLLFCPDLLSKSEVVPTTFSDSGRLQHHQHQLGVKSLPALCLHGGSGGFALLNRSAVVPTFGQESWQPSRIQYSLTSLLGNGWFLCRLLALRHKGTATVLVTWPISLPSYSGWHTAKMRLLALQNAEKHIFVINMLK